MSARARTKPVEVVTEADLGMTPLAPEASFKAKAYDIGLNVKTGSPAQPAQTIAREIALWGPVTKTLGIKPE